MSNPNPPEIPQGDPIQQAIDSVVNKTASGIPLEINLGTGEIFRGATPEELLNKLASAKTEATHTIRAQKTQLDEMKSKVAELEQRIPPPAPDPSKDKDNAFYETWAKNPKAAFRMQLGEELGVSPDRAVEILKETIKTGLSSQAADEFVMRHPDFPQSPQSSGMMIETLGKRFGQTIESTSADNLELVYHQLLREGRLQPRQVPTERIMNPNAVMPNLRGNSAPVNPAGDVERQIRTMPLDKLKETIDRLSSQGR